MNRLLIPLAFAATLPLPCLAAPVTWDFQVTSCNTPPTPGNHEGCDPTAKYPVALATLTLDGPNSSGSATLDAFFGKTVLIGDPFSFVLSQNSHEFASTADPLGAGWANGTPPPGRDGLVDYSIAWSEVAGVLTSVNISFLTEFDEVNRLGLTGGMAGSDGEMVGCADALCDVSGFWVDAPSAVKEPGVIMVWLLGLLGIIGVRYRSRMSDSRAKVV